INIFREKGYAFAALTDQVRPVVHSLGRNKWSRQVNLQDHAHMLAAVHVASQTKIEEKEEPEAAVPLQLKGGSETYVIDSESYFVERGHIHISLRAWSEERGLKLHWNKEEKTAY